MTFNQWFLFLIAIQIIHFLGTWKLYVKAGRKAWEAIVPIYNAVVLMQIINRPKWWGNSSFCTYYKFINVSNNLGGND